MTIMNRDGEFEVHPFNREVWRYPGGIWGESSLPVEDWEAPEVRVVLPENLHASLLPIAPVLRWNRTKYQQVVATHFADLPVIQDLTRHLGRWVFHGVEPHHRHQRILFPDGKGRWYAVSVGRLLGSDNMITIVGSSRRGFVKNRLRGLEDVRKSAR